MNVKREQSFAGAMDLVLQAQAATDHLKELCAACACGDKSAARRRLREAISELEIARTMLRTGLE
ncbi:MAG: hypothetical protein JO141_08625 [Bradyrhizobium sp.]|nr:hypothetical protein [Bradyrhizobium sp.]